jgi:histidinol-phosphatase (PHP family)
MDNPILLKAMECDYLPEYHGYYQEELLGRFDLDYLVGAVHFVCRGTEDLSLHRGTIDAKDLVRYTEQYIDMIRSGLFLFGAHPDVFGMVYHRWDAHAAACSHAICEAAAASRFPLEINGNGFRRPPIRTLAGMQRPYPLEQFWNIAAEHGVQAVVNSDAHHPKDVGASMDACISFGENLGVQLCNLSLPHGRWKGDSVKLVPAFVYGDTGHR